MAVQEPVGVACLITPWNFPIAMITRKVSSKSFFMSVILFHSQLHYISHLFFLQVAPALAAGCTVVLKPSETTPLTAIAVKQLANRAGIPDEVFQLV